jgi:hypothetical protein
MNAQMIDTVSGYGRGERCGKAGGAGAVALMSGCLARSFTAIARKSAATAVGVKTLKTPFFSGF